MIHLTHLSVRSTITDLLLDSQPWLFIKGSRPPTLESLNHATREGLRGPGSEAPGIAAQKRKI